MFSELGNETMCVLGLKRIKNRLSIMDDAVFEAFESDIVLRIVQPRRQRITRTGEQHWKPLQTMFLDFVQQRIIITPIKNSPLPFYPTPAHVRFHAVEANRANERQMISQIRAIGFRSEEHTSELQSHSFISYAVFCLK